MSTRLFKHAPTAVVAVTVVGLALADGAYSLTARGVLAIALWWAIILGLGFGLLPFRRPGREAYLTGGLLAGLGVLAAVSIAWSLSPERSFVEFDRIALYLGVFILAVLVSTRTNVTRWADGLAIGVAAIGLLALASGLFPGLIPGDENISRIPEGLIAFPFGYWNALGVMLAMGLPLLLRASVAARSLAARGLALGLVPGVSAAIFLSGSRGAVGASLVGVVALLVLVKPRAAAIWAAVCAGAGSALLVVALTTREALSENPSDAPALAAAQARSFAAIALAVCMGVGLAYVGGVAGARARAISPPRLAVGRPARIALGALAAAAVAGALLTADLGQALESFKQTPLERGGTAGASGFANAAGGGRYQVWTAAVEEFRAYPLFGGGAGSYQLWWAANREFPFYVRDAHSLYLETLGELGLAGLALLLGALGYGLLTGLSRLRARTGAERATVAALCATLLAWAVAAALDWMWEMPLITGVAILCLGVMVGPATAPEASASAPAEQAPARARRGRRSFNLGVAVIAAAWLVICAQAVPLLSELRLQDSRRAAALGDFAAAAQAAQGARMLEPWASTPYHQLALIERDRGDTAAARRYIDAAIEREPGNYVLWYIAARVEVDAGNPAGARRRLERSRSLDPTVASQRRLGADG